MKTFSVVPIRCIYAFTVIIIIIIISCSSSRNYSGTGAI